MFDQGPIGDNERRVRIDCYDDPLCPMNGINSLKGCSAESMTLNTIIGSARGSQIEQTEAHLAPHEKLLLDTLINDNGATKDAFRTVFCRF